MKKTIQSILTSPALTASFAAGVLFTVFTLFPFRLDFSKGAAYTISSSTRKILSAAKKQIVITVYVSDELPTRLIPLKSDILQFINELRRSNQQVKIVTVDPKSDTKVAQKAQQFGIPQLQFSQLEQNKYQTSSFYFGLTIEYDGKTEAIPQLSDYTNLEYNLASAVYRLTRKTMPKVGMSGDQGQAGVLRQTLGQQYAVSDIDLKNPIRDIDTLFLFDDGTTKYEEPEISTLKTFYESGHTLFLFADGIHIDEQSLQTTPAEHNLNALIKPYGITIEKNLVLSMASEYVNFGSAAMQILTPYPFWIKTNAFAKEPGLFVNTQYLSFPWVSSLATSRSKNTKITPLVMSADRSWTQSASITLNPNLIPQPTSKDMKISMLVTRVSHTNGGNIMVIPSSRFVKDRYLSRGSGNIDFVLNAADLYTSHGDLSGIRSRTPAFYPLPDLAETAKNIYKYAAILLGPVLWLGYGIIRMTRRQRSN